MTSLISMTVLGVGLVADPTINDVVQRNFQDASLVSKIELMKQSELVKIKKDFANNYRVKSTKIWIKEPHMIRIEAKVEDTDVLFVVNGNRRLAKIPRAGINSKETFERAPGKRQTLLDFGLITPSMFADPFSAKFVRIDRQSGDYVFDVIYNQSKYDDKTRMRIWVDKDKKFTAKREWYNQEGRFLATFVYDEPVKDGDVFVPTKVTALNAEGKVAGITRYSSIKVNTGLNASLFEIR